MANLSTKILDHVPHLSPPGTLAQSVDTFTKLGFTVVSGGDHMEGGTANALVVFADGTYLELIHFIAPPTPDNPHPWAQRQPGWVDLAFLGNAGTPSVAQTINDRAQAEGSPVRFVGEMPGGRTLEDGTVLKWLISGAVGDGVRGKLPFFCGDVTPRELRVPTSPASNVQHANTALGVAYVKLLVAPEDLDVSTKQMVTVLGAAPSSSDPKQVVWEVEEQPSHTGVHKNPARLILSVVQNDEETGHVRERGPGIYEVGFLVQEVPNDGSLVRTPYGRLVWVAVE
ncbi:glyoxalase-like domain-containing protein [Daedaleopsis nitida]|nr:glyoxalase-like domain-containing protein [Daedaleopsis nitida]